MNNSMNIECILEFSNINDRERWKQVIISKATEINLVLGKSKRDINSYSYTDKFQRFETINTNLPKEERDIASKTRDGQIDPS